MTASDPRVLLRSLFDAAVAAADPALIVPQHLPEPPKGRTIVVGAGKAAAAMAAAVEKHWRGPLEGLVVTRYGHGAPTRRIRVVEAAHPDPTRRHGGGAAKSWRWCVAGPSDDLVLALISGGGSALLSLPAARLTLADKQAINRALLRAARDRRDERRAQASLGDQGRPARDGRGAGARRDPGHLRRAGRRPVGDRLRPDRRRSDHAARMPAPCSSATVSTSRRASPPISASRERDAEARRPEARQRENRLIATPRDSLARRGGQSARGGLSRPSFSATRSKARRANVGNVHRRHCAQAPRGTATRSRRPACCSPAARRR